VADLYLLSAGVTVFLLVRAGLAGLAGFAAAVCPALGFAAAAGLVLPPVAASPALGFADAAAGLAGFLRANAPEAMAGPVAAVLSRS
jgi:hypothetical protein